MSILGSTQVLTAVVKNKIKQIGTAAKILGCLPSILTGISSLGSGSVVGQVGSLITGGAIKLISGLSGLIGSIVNDTLSQITAAVRDLVKKVLSIQAEITRSLQVALGLIDAIKKEASDVVNFIENEENCRFAAAELLKCVAGKALESIADISSKLGGGSSLNIKDLASNITEKISKPGEILDKWTLKTAQSIDHASAQINATNLF